MAAQSGSALGLSQLSPDPLTNLQEAAIFGSDFDLLAAEAILGAAGITPIDVLDNLDPLVEHHLISRDHLRARSRILEPIRQSLAVVDRSRCR